VAPRKKPSTAVVVQPRVQEAETPDETAELEDLLDKVALWQQVWDLKWSGVSFRRIGQELGIPKSTAHHYYHQFRKYRGVSPKIEEEREHQLAGLAELEARLIREATKGEAAWTATTVALRGIYADRREILGFSTAAPASGRGEAGVGQPDAGAGVGMPDAVAAVIGRLSLVK